MTNLQIAITVVLIGFNMFSLLTWGRNLTVYAIKKTHELSVLELTSRLIFVVGAITTATWVLTL